MEKRQYEAMFLFDPSFAGDFKNVESEIQRLMERADGEIIVCRKWDERKLAYEIDGRKRGTYVLAYFKAPPSKIKPMERDAQLSDHVLRLLVLRADELTRERMESFYPQERRAEPSTEATEGGAAPESGPSEDSEQSEPSTVGASTESESEGEDREG